MTTDAATPGHKPPLPATLAKHGITEAMWWELYEFQHGVCAVCLKWHAEYVIDHDHKRGQQRVRGLVGRMCNRKLGQVRDDWDWCQRAADYLRLPPAPLLDSFKSTPYPEAKRPTTRRRTGGSK